MNRKIALVTGASGGLGTFVTKALLDTDFGVVGLAPRIQQADYDHPNFTALPVSLDSLDAAKKVADTIMGLFGKIDVLAHLVGGLSADHPLPTRTIRRFRHVRHEREHCISYFSRGDSAHAQSGGRTHRRHWQPRSRGSGDFGWGLQRVQGGSGVAGEDCGD